LSPRFVLPLLLAVTAACTPIYREAGPPVTDPVVTDDTLVMADGMALDLHVWPAEEPVQAVIVALHGFNDYGNAFALPAEFWAAEGIQTYAYDQRGFGGSPDAGYWAGTPSLVSDVHAALGLLTERHAGVPVYLLGESMGGAIAAVAASRGLPDGVEGLILVAPAVWGRDTMPWFYRASLCIVAHVAPGARLSGSGLDIWPSDNIDMLRALAHDPRVIKETRADTTLGLVRLMDDGLLSAPAIATPTLLIYGANDQIVPPEPIVRFSRQVTAPLTVALYPEGYHMVLRDLSRAVPAADVAAFVLEPGGMLPSGRAIAVDDLLPEITRIHADLP